MKFSGLQGCLVCFDLLLSQFVYIWLWGEAVSGHVYNSEFGKFTTGERVTLQIVKPVLTRQYRFGTTPNIE